MAEVQTIFAAYGHARTRAKNKPFQLAFNGPISDMPFQLPLTAVDKLPLPSVGEGWGEGAIPQLAFADSSPYLLAQAGDAPTTADLASTPEIQVDSPLIHAKAQELGCSPVKLYEWTRNEIFFTPTYGAIHKAQRCASKQRSATRSIPTLLLVALLRSCNIPARLNIGTIELPIEKVMNWAGGFSDPTTALNYLASGGISVTGLRSGGMIFRRDSKPHGPGRSWTISRRLGLYIKWVIRGFL